MCILFELCRYITVTLPLHCRDIAVTGLGHVHPFRAMPLQYRYSTVTLPLHYRDVAVTGLGHVHPLRAMPGLAVRVPAQARRPDARNATARQALPRGVAEWGSSQFSYLMTWKPRYTTRRRLHR